MLPIRATQHLLENSDGYDIVGYMEDDISIEDEYFLKKLNAFTMIYQKNTQ